MSDRNEGWLTVTGYGVVINEEVKAASESTTKSSEHGTIASHPHSNGTSNGDTATKKRGRDFYPRASA